MQMMMPTSWSYYDNVMPQPPMDYYNDYNEYWNGNIFPDCCTYQCSIECYPRIDPDPPTTTVKSCSYSVPGWNIINGKRVYLGDREDHLTWFAAEAKAIEVGGHLLEIRSPSDNLIFAQIRTCKADFLVILVFLASQNVVSTLLELVNNQEFHNHLKLKIEIEIYFQIKLHCYINVIQQYH